MINWKEKVGELTSKAVAEQQLKRLRAEGMTGWKMKSVKVGNKVKYVVYH